MASEGVQEGGELSEKELGPGWPEAGGLRAPEPFQHLPVPLGLVWWKAAPFSHQWRPVTIQGCGNCLDLHAAQHWAAKGARSNLAAQVQSSKCLWYLGHPHWHLPAPCECLQSYQVLSGKMSCTVCGVWGQLSHTAQSTQPRKLSFCSQHPPSLMQFLGILLKQKQVSSEAWFQRAKNK